MNSFSIFLPWSLGRYRDGYWFCILVIRISNRLNRSRCYHLLPICKVYDEQILEELGNKEANNELQDKVAKL